MEYQVAFVLSNADREDEHTLMDNFPIRNRVQAFLKRNPTLKIARQEIDFEYDDDGQRVAIVYFSLL